MLGAPNTGSVRWMLDPQLLFAAIETFTLAKVGGKSTEIALRLFGPDIEAPLFTVQV
jgi:hypothetical protein